VCTALSGAALRCGGEKSEDGRERVRLTGPITQRVNAREGGRWVGWAAIAVGPGRLV
jgi:hypothetical protein